MSSYRLIGPSGHVYRIETEYVEGVSSRDASPWRGWRVRYRVSGTPAPFTIYLDGREEEELDPRFVGRQVDHHFVTVILPLRERLGRFAGRSGRRDDVRVEQEERDG